MSKYSRTPDVRHWQLSTNDELIRKIFGADASDRDRDLYLLKYSPHVARHLIARVIGYAIAHNLLISPSLPPSDKS
jgi:hypothetical protein